jgi:hypothetical protein
MSNDEKRSEGADLTPDTPLERMPSLDDSNLVVLRGHVGDDPDDPDAVRLYDTLEFRAYSRIARADIAHRHKVAGDSGAGSILWVRRDATIARRRVDAQTMRADFLRGAINPAGPRAMGDFTANPGVQFTSLPCVATVTVTVTITTTIFTSHTDSTNSECCPTDVCSNTSQCLC